MFAAMVKPNHPEEDKSVGSEKSTFVETSPPILAYIDDPAHSEMIVPHAVAMAGALEASLTLLHVLGLPHGAPPPPDPIAWSIRRRRAGESLRQIAKAQTSTGIHMDISVDV